MESVMFGTPDYWNRGTWNHKNSLVQKFYKFFKNPVFGIPPFHFLKFWGLLSKHT
jgi:hypothetical protein